MVTVDGGVAAIFGSMAVASDTPSTERGAICQDRPECRIVETLDAGKAADGTALAVLRRVGREDQPTDAEGRQCRPYPEDYWLKQVGRDGKATYRRLFAFVTMAMALPGLGKMSSRSLRIASRSTGWAAVPGAGRSARAIN